MTSHVFCRPYNVAPHLRPVNARVQLLLHQSHQHNVVSANEVKPVAGLGAGLWVVGRANDALDGVAEDEVGDLVAG